MDAFAFTTASRSTPTRPDPLDGPALAAVFFHGQHTDVLPGCDTAGFHAMLVSGHGACVGRVGAATWVTWSPWFDRSQEVDYYGVVALGLPESAVLRAARHLVGRDGEPRITSGGLAPGCARWPPEP